MSAEHVMAGDSLRVRPGEKMPVDGVVTEGHVTIDESMVTGESLPVSKQPGSQVIGGTLNSSGSFLMWAEKVGRDTMLARIVQMVAEAQRSRAPIQRLADRVSAWFVPLVIAAAVAAFVAWSVWGPEPRLCYATGRRCRRAHHRLPVCARTCNADVDHGGRRAGRSSPAC